MGYTLITRFSAESLSYINEIISNTGIPSNKIPFGRDCDRVKADKLLPYHVTVLSWKRQYDDVYLPLIRGYQCPGPSLLSITGTTTLLGQEGSLVLCFKINPGGTYLKYTHELGQRLHIKTSRFPHITLAVSKNHDEIKRIKQMIDASLKYPFSVTVEGFDLYHVWKPVKKVGEY